MAVTFRDRTVRVVLVVIGVLTMTPVLALVDLAQLDSYGVSGPGPVELTLLQHRGVLQLVLGAALVWSAFRPAVRVPVAIAAIVAKGSFLGLLAARPDVLGAASPVTLVFDPLCIVALSALLVGAGLRSRRRRTEPSPA